MRLTQYHFVLSQPNSRLGNIAWEGYLEAGKTYGIKTRFLPGTPEDVAFQKGWNIRMDELQTK